ncbi:hypothetical protein DPMN_061203 [Dreissena polymorpha]|uniref:MIF4G domain-containing protein n=1 Tax=Dreissena polymorpha TaxID=45954 RepID=A0A9D4HI67_DREPO|nr:hypothetical protein DPMN_061203 [Dreissena polymorpha]
MISELVKGPPPDLPQLSGRIQSILETLKKLQNNWTTNMLVLEASYNKQLHEIRETRQKMITILDEMEKICMNELYDKMTSLNACLKTDLDNSSMLQNELKRFSEAIHFTVDKGKAELAYIASKKSAVLIQKSETYLNEKYVEVNSILIFQANSDFQQYLFKLSGFQRIVPSKRVFAGIDSPEQVFSLKGMSTSREVLEDAELEEDESHIDLRFKCTEDQWSTPEDKKLNDFPLKLQLKSAATTKAKDLPDVVLHKAENAWKPGHLKPGKDAEVDEATELYKKIRSILNRLTPQKFKVLLPQMNGLKIDTESKLKGVIDIVFEKAISESNYSFAYATMCRCLSMLREQSDSNPNENVNFRAVLLTRCQREFEKDKSSAVGVVTKRVKLAKCDHCSKKF